MNAFFGAALAWIKANPLIAGMWVTGALALVALGMGSWKAFAFFGLFCVALGITQAGAWEAVGEGAGKVFGAVLSGVWAFVCTFPRIAALMASCAVFAGALVGILPVNAVLLGFIIGVGILASFFTGSGEKIKDATKRLS